ncbi:hypothetical protein G7Y89_g13036 [Cudoniella acicularis]|uniref:Uncharacterized protein n=1 Tax=Cudoniella acicularis TaxID=354080 RepID=A0A8H4R901_9HELO|nr:hypothetical protein G7Y89_g13036 [Cudoniella acicularis]
MTECDNGYESPQSPEEEGVFFGNGTQNGKERRRIIYSGNIDNALVGDYNSGSHRGNQDANNQQSKESDMEGGVEKFGIRDRISCFTWTWYTMTMATGGIANVLHSRTILTNIAQYGLPHTGQWLQTTMQCFYLPSHDLKAPSRDQPARRGLSGFTIAGIVHLGSTVVSKIMPIQYMGNQNTAFFLKLMADILGLWIWGLYLWIFIVSVGAHWKHMIPGDKKHVIRFDMTWYSFVFPNTALLTATLAIGKSLGFNAIQIFGTVIAVILVPRLSQDATPPTNFRKHVTIQTEKQIRAAAAATCCLTSIRSALEASSKTFLKQIENYYSAKGRDIVRYHADSESEDHRESEEESEGEDENSDAEEKRRLRKPIQIGDDELVAKYAKCENYKEEIDLTLDDRGDCVWHPGEKEVDYEGDFWADHDEDCHDLIRDLEDDPDFAKGFMWTCCEKNGDDPGCKETRHKNAVNIICPRTQSPVPVSRKREARAIEIARCENCNEGFNIHGYKQVTFETDEFWANHDEEFHSYLDALVDDPQFADGYQWSCCKELGSMAGCKKQRHVPMGLGARKKRRVPQPKVAKEFLKSS